MDAERLNRLNAVVKIWHSKNNDLATSFSKTIKYGFKWPKSGRILMDTATFILITAKNLQKQSFLYSYLISSACH